VALHVQHAIRMLYTILSSVASLALPHFSTLLINGTIFGGEKVTEHKMCVLMFSTPLSTAFLILRRIQRDIINIHRSSCKVAGNVAF
jgi:TRAP-type C4-dicarboxylate transport system permease small subunit